MLEAIVLGGIIGLWGFVWTRILTGPDHILGVLGRWTINWPEWIRKPLIDCPICHAGQVALWVSIAHFGTFSFEGCFSLVTVALFISYQASKNE